MFKPGDLVFVKHNNRGRAGGGIPDAFVGVFRRVMEQPPEFNGEAIKTEAIKNDGKGVAVRDEEQPLNFSFAPESLVRIARVIPDDEKEGIYIYSTIRGAWMGHNGDAGPYRFSQLAGTLEKIRATHLGADAPAAAIKAPAPVVIDIKAKLAEMKVELDKNVEQSGVSTCSYAMLFIDGKIRYQARDVCHARFKRQHGEKELAGAYMNIAGHAKDFNDKEKAGYSVFLHYMLNDSPWAKAFLTKDAEEAIGGGIFFDVQQDASLVYSGAIALRSYTEYNNERQNWIAMEGIIPLEQRFLLARVVYKEADGWKWACCNNGHSVFGSSRDKGSLVAFFKTGFKNKFSKFATHTGGIYCEDPIIEGQPQANISLNDFAKATKNASRGEEQVWGVPPLRFSVKQLSEFAKEIFA